MKKLITETINESVDLDGVLLIDAIDLFTEFVKSNPKHSSIKFDRVYYGEYSEINIIGTRYETDEEELAREKTVEYNEKCKRDAEFKQYQKLKEKFETKE